MGERRKTFSRCSQSRNSAKAANSEFCAARFSTFSAFGEPAVGNSTEADEDAAGEQSTTIATSDPATM